MARRSEFVESAEDALQHIGPVHVRAMFGGYGVFLDGVMFGLIADDVLYLKVDDTNRDAFEQAGLEPFVYEAGRGPIQMSYHRAPGSVDDWESVEPWVSGAIAASRRVKAAKKPGWPRRAG
jgi:DNA transformation protein and related proteins